VSSRPVRPLVPLAAVQTGWIAPELQSRIARTFPLGRLGTPADVADVVLSFASVQARWVTGQVRYVGGGHAREVGTVRRVEADRP